MEDKSNISYWLDEEQILVVPTKKVPEKGEEIYINTKMNEIWHDVRFKDRKLFNEGVSGNFVVQSVKRYYKVLDYVHEEPSIISTGGGTGGNGTVQGVYKMPAQATIENFEVFLERKEE